MKQRMKASLHLFQWLFVGLCLATTNALAQSYPTKPIRLIIPGPPGGGLDLVSRVVGQNLAERLGQPVIPDNRAGASGITASEMAAKAPADGYTLIVANSQSHGANVGLFKQLPYDPINDFAPISLVALTPLILVVNPSFPAKSVKELIELAKAKPGELNYASNGNGTASHLTAEMFKSRAGIKLTHVPFKGSAPALSALLGGHVSLLFDNLVSALPQVSSGQLRGLAVTSSKRSSALPDVPTMAEAGLPNFEATNWYGFVAPAGTPKEIVAKLNQEIVAIMQQPDVRSRLAGLGGGLVSTTPAEFSAFIKSEIAKWAAVVKESGATVD